MSALPSSNNTRICVKAGDLPPYDRVISGTERSAFIHLKAEAAEHIVVARDRENGAIIFANASMRGDADMLAWFRNINVALDSRGMQRRTTVWAIPPLIAELTKVKSRGSVHTDSPQDEKAKEKQREDFNKLLRYALDNRATDIHLESRRNVAKLRFRIDQLLEPMRHQSGGEMLPDVAEGMIATVFNILSDEKTTSSSHFNSQQSAYAMLTWPMPDRDVKIRCQAIPLVNGFDFVGRILPEKSQSMTYAELGYADSHIELIETATATHRGLIIIAGVTNSGKTTTAKSMLERMPERDSLKLVSIEDPVENEIDGVSQTVIQRDVSDDGESTEKIMEAVKSWMRGDIDVIMLGEIRDGATGVAALTQSETGHLALGTLHAHSAIGIVQRLTSRAVGLDIDSLTFPDILSLLMYQGLAPVLCKECRIPLREMPLPIQKRFDWIASRFKVDVSGMYFKREEGCECCRGRGTTGMTVVAEIIPPSHEFLELIREGKVYKALEHWMNTSDGRFDSDNMTGKPVFAHAFRKAQLGIIDPRTVDRFTRYEVFADRHLPREGGTMRGRAA